MVACCETCVAKWWNGDELLILQHLAQVVWRSIKPNGILRIKCRSANCKVSVLGVATITGVTDVIRGGGSDEGPGSVEFMVQS